MKDWQFHLVYLVLLVCVLLFVLSGCASKPLERIPTHKQIVVDIKPRAVCSQEQQGRSIVVYTCR